MSEVSEVSEGDPSFLLDAEVQDSADSSPDCLPIDEGSPTSEVSGVSVKARLDLLLTQGGSKQDALNILKKLFGKNLLDRVIQQENCAQLPEHIDPKDVLLLIETIGNIFTIKDLGQVLAELQKGDYTRKILQYLPHHIFWKWWTCSINDLPDYWINYLLELFRNPLAKIDPSTYGDLRKDCSEDDFSKVTISRYDSMMRDLQQNQSRLLRETPLSHKELLARYLAYIDPHTTPIGVLIPVFNETTKKLDYYKLAHKICHKGLTCFFFVPIKPAPGRPAQLIFSGTDLKDPSTIRRDFDKTGVGKSSFAESAPQIKEVVKSWSQQQQLSNAALDIVGFSLGAADGQRTALELVVESQLLAHLSCITLFAFCAPKLDKKSTERWRQALLALAKSPQQHCPQMRLYFAQHKKDIIPWLGGDRHLSATKNFHIQTDYFIVCSPESRFMKKGDHTTFFFNKRGDFDYSIDKRSYKIYKNVDPNLIEQKARQLAEHQRHLNAWYGALFAVCTTLMSRLFHLESTYKELQESVEKLQLQDQQFQESVVSSPTFFEVLFFKLSYLLLSNTTGLFWGHEPITAT